LARTEHVVHGKHWSDLGATDEKLGLTLNRITHLKAAGLTIEHVVADFIWRHIASLQRMDRYTWEYANAGDRMRLYPGRGYNLTVMSHAWLCEQLFHKTDSFHLSARVIPLHINSAVG
jgi:hypothetical protein